MTETTSAIRTCFLISPIGEEGSETRVRSDKVKRLIVEPALVPGLVARVDRADESVNPGEITPVIVSSILAADLIVADLTDGNPNVAYELAIAHAYRKPTVHIRLAGESLPFDLKDVRVFEYGMDLEIGDRARVMIRDAAQAVLSNPASVRTPVSGGAALLQADRSGDPADRLSAQILTRLSGIETAVARLASPRAGLHPGPTELRILEINADAAERRVESARAQGVALRAEYEAAYADAGGPDPQKLAELEVATQAAEVAQAELALIAEEIAAQRTLMRTRAARLHPDGSVDKSRGITITASSPERNVGRSPNSGPS